MTLLTSHLPPEHHAVAYSSFFTAVSGYLFLVLYSTHSRWWRTWDGWMIFILVFSFATLSWLRLAETIGVESSTIDWIRSVFSVLAGIQLVYWITVVINIPFTRSRRRKRPPSPPSPPPGDP